MIGETMFVSGVAMFLTALIVGRLMVKYDMRYLIAIGLVLFALGSYQMTWITEEWFLRIAAAADPARPA